MERALGLPLRYVSANHFEVLAGRFDSSLGIVTLFAIALTKAQNESLQNTAAIFITGTVRDRASAPVVDATVVLEEKARSASLEAKTGTQGTFSFLALRAGVYVVRARKAGWREAGTEPIELSLGQNKNFDLVLDPANPGESASPGTAQPSSSSSMPPSPSAAMEFSDKPNFTVAGVTDSRISRLCTIFE